LGGSEDFKIPDRDGGENAIIKLHTHQRVIAVRRSIGTDDHSALQSCQQRIDADVLDPVAYAWQVWKRFEVLHDLGCS
jgi:hypothetical protein